MYLPISAKVPASGMQDRSENLFRQGMQCLANKKWTEAEEVFKTLIQNKSSYRFNGRSARKMLDITRYERKGYTALENRDLNQALAYFHKAGNLDKTLQIEDQIIIEDYQARANEYEKGEQFHHAAWIYDQLIKRFPNHRKKVMWKAAYTENWHRELFPIFDRGLELFEQSNWLEAKEAFTKVACADPNFRRHGKMAGALLDQCKREIRKIANTAMAKGHLKDALSGYEEIFDMHKVAQINELLELQTKGEAIARDYIKKERWEAAVAVYDWLLTLSFGDAKLKEWQEKRDLYARLAKLIDLFNEGLAAQEQKNWRVATEKFAAIKRIDPKFGKGTLRVSKMHRAAQMKMHFASILG